MSAKTGWRGVAWPPIVHGLCTKHGTRVGTFTGICIDCHRDQLEAARRGSREHERPSA